MIIITGASGKLGSRIVNRLLELVPSESVGVSVRDVDKAASLADRGVRVRHGDFTAPETLKHAFEGADRVLVVSAAIQGSGALDANCAAIDAACEAGASGVLYTSHQAASTESFFGPAVVHAQTETHLASKGIPFTAFRNGFYASSLLYQINDAIETGKIRAPQDGPVSWTSHDDLAEVAAKALAQDRLHPGITPPLTAGETLDLAQVGERLSKIAGQPIERIVVDDDEWKASAIKAGLPPQAVEFIFGQYLAARNGEFAVVDPTLEQIVGHSAIPVDETLQKLTDSASQP